MSSIRGFRQHQIVGYEFAAPDYLVNGNFESWQLGDGPFPCSTSSLFGPDEWECGKGDSGTAAQVSRDQTFTKFGTSSARLDVGAVVGGAGAYIQQGIEQYKSIEGQFVTFCAWVKADKANSVNLQIYDITGSGGDSTFSAFHTGGGGWELLVATKQIRQNLVPNSTSPHSYGAGVMVNVFQSSTQAYVDAASFVLGNYPEGVIFKPIPSGPHSISSHYNTKDFLEGLSSVRNLSIDWSSYSQIVIRAGSKLLSEDMLYSVKFTADTTVSILTSGVNGLDNGSEAPSTWYYIWAISDGVNTPKGLLSTSQSSPTMPSGYIYKRLIGSVYNDSAGDLTFFRQRNDIVYISSKVWFSNEQPGIFNGSYTRLDWRPLSSSHISPLAAEVLAHIYQNSLSETGTESGSPVAHLFAWTYALPMGPPSQPATKEEIGFVVDTVFNSTVFPGGSVQATHINNQGINTLFMPVSNQTVYFRSTSASLSPNYPRITGYVCGYKYFGIM